MRHVILATLVIGTGASCASAQQGNGAALEQKVLGRRDGDFRIAFATKPGVCGSGEHNISIRDDDDDDWQSDCKHGPALVTIRMRDGQLADVKTRVGGTWLPRSDVTDLGTVASRDAADLFLRLARQDGKGADEAILPALIADSADVWRDLLALARSDRVRTDVRKSAVFWVGQAAATAATKGLTDVVGDDAVDREVRESAVFALSQRPRDEAVPALLAVARTHKDPQIRRKAIFWLGQTEDPRAVAYFEEVLTK